jgi:hypothetical protein
LIKVDEERIAMHKIHTASNLADAFTKSMQVEAIIQSAMVRLDNGVPRADSREDAEFQETAGSVPAMSEAEPRSGQGGGAPGADLPIAGAEIANPNPVEEAELDQEPADLIPIDAELAQGELGHRNPLPEFEQRNYQLRRGSRVDYARLHRVGFKRG